MTITTTCSSFSALSLQICQKGQGEEGGEGEAEGGAILPGQPWDNIQPRTPLFCPRGPRRNLHEGHH